MLSHPSLNRRDRADKRPAKGSLEELMFWCCSMENEADSAALRVVEDASTRYAVSGSRGRGKIG
jgi:hypothetical protein